MKKVKFAFSLMMLLLMAAKVPASISGHLLVVTHSSDYQSQTFWTVDPTTGTKTQHGTAVIGSYNNGMGFSNGKLYVAQDQYFRLLEVDLESGAYSVIASRNVDGVIFHNLRDLTIASDGGLWVNCGISVSRIDPVTGVQNPLYTDMWESPGGLTNSHYIATESSGMMLRTFLSSILDGDGGVTRLDPATGTETLLASGMDNPYGIAVADDGSIFVVEERRDGSHPDYVGIHRIDPVTGVETVVSTDPLLGPFASGDLVWASGQGLFMIDYGANNSILSIDVTTGAASTLATFDRNAVGILGAGMAVVPEPATVSLLALGGLALLRRRK